MPDTLEQYWISPAPDAVSCELGGETVILDMPSGRYFALDPVGTRIWEWLQTPCTLAELCERLLEEFEVEPGTCRRDVSNLLNELAKNGLVRFAGRT